MRRQKPFGVQVHALVSEARSERAAKAPLTLASPRRHSYWHILIAAASFFYHRFCFFSVQDEVEPLGRPMVFTIRSGSRSRIMKGGREVSDVTLEERSSLTVSDDGKEIMIKGIDILL